MSQTFLPTAIQSTSIHVKRCPECGTVFEPYSRRTRAHKYCRPACRDKAWNRAKRIRAGKRDNNAQKILRRLEEGPADTMELARVGGVRFGARIKELRDDGHQITTEEHGDFAVYTLTDASCTEPQPYTGNTRNG